MAIEQFRKRYSEGIIRNCTVNVCTCLNGMCTEKCILEKKAVELQVRDCERAAIHSRLTNLKIDTNEVFNLKVSIDKDAVVRIMSHVVPIDIAKLIYEYRDFYYDTRILPDYTNQLLLRYRDLLEHTNKYPSLGYCRVIRDWRLQENVRIWKLYAAV